MSKKLLVRFFQALVSIGLLIVVIRLVRLDSLKVALADPTPLLIATALTFCGILIRSWRWQGLTSALGIPAGIRRLIALFFIGQFFSRLLPTGVGGDAVRVYELTKDGATSAVGTASVLMDRATGLVSLVLVALVALLFGFHLLPQELAFLIVALSLGVLVAFGAFVWLERWIGLAEAVPVLGSIFRTRWIQTLAESVGRFGKGSILRSTACCSL